MTFQEYVLDYQALIERSCLMAKRPLPKPEVLSSCKDQSLPKRPPMGQRPVPIAKELNKQRQRPVYDERRS